MTQSLWGFSADALKKYRTLIISLIFLIFLAVTSILISLYFSSLYNKSFSRYSALTQGIDLQHDFVIGLQAAADANHSPETRLHYANMAVIAYDELKSFYPVFLKGGEAHYGASKIEKTIAIAPPIDELDNSQTADLYNKVLTNTLKPREKLIEKLRQAKTDSFEKDTNLDIELGTEVDSELINWGSGFIAFNKVRDDLQKRANHYNDINRTVLFTSILVLLGYFAIIALNNLRRLVKSDAQIEAARRETDDIMSNVNTGLFLLDRDLVIGSQYSHQLTQIIGTNKIAGQNLTSLLKNKVSEKDLETTQGFVKQLYNPRVKEKLINDLNPLKKVMLQDEQHRGQNRFLDFTFSRVTHNNQIDRILVNVQDITPQVRLEQRLEHERAQNDLQVEMLTTILNVSPAIISEFIRNTKENIVKINNVLKSSGSNQSALEDKLVRIYRIMHSIKGESSALSLHSFTTIATNFEEKLKGLQSQSKLAGNDFLPLTIHLDELLNLSNTIEALGKRINQHSPVANAKPSPSVSDTHKIEESVSDFLTTEVNKTVVEPVTNPFRDTSTSVSPMTEIAITPITEVIIPTPLAPVAGRNDFYQQFANNIAVRQRKEVQLTAFGFDEIVLPAPLEAGVKEIVIQLIRNAVVHGIETPQERTAQGKPACGTVSLDLADLEDSYQITIEDDGHGINYDAIRHRAVEMGYSANEIELWTKQKLNALLFKSGFSTKKETDEDAGRGVGMDIIKERVKALQGQLGLDTKEGTFTRFSIKLPKTLLNA